MVVEKAITWSSNAETVEAAYQEKSQDDFLLFTQGLVIPSATGPQLFKNCIADFQLKCFGDLALSLHAVRDGVMPPCRRFWIERTKKAAKDSDAAICILWLMVFAKRPFKIQICAANQKQASIIENRAVELLHYNPWLKDRVEIVQRVIRSRVMPREVWTHIEATGRAEEAHGETPDLLVLNELVHVERWGVMETHMNNADGVPQGVVVVFTNAGVRGTKAEQWRKYALENKGRWHSHIWHNRAPWVNEDDVREAKQRDPIGAEFERLWNGRWISGIGGALSQDEIDRCFVLDGELEKIEKGWIYSAGLDLGISHDHSGVVVLGANMAEQRIKVVYLRGWEPSVPNDKGVLEVDSAAVELECFRLNGLYGLHSFWYDPAAGGSFMAQRLRKRGLPVREMGFTASSLTLMAKSFVQVVKDGKLECFEDEEGRLRRDFGKFQIEHRPPSNYKLLAVSDEYGHADVGTALVVCLPCAVGLMGGGWMQQDDVLWDENDEPLDEEERSELPDELADIYDTSEEIEDEERIRKRHQFDYPDLV